MKKALYAILLLMIGTRLYGESESINTPLGGLSTTDPSFRISSKFSPYMRNVFIDQGKIGGINGFQALGSTNTLQKVTGIFPYYQESGAISYLVTDSSVTLETTDFQIWTFVSSGSNTGSLLTWMQVRNKMWGFNGVDPVVTWDRTTKTILNGSGSTPNVPKFKYGAYWHERVWGFNTSGGASDLYFSALTSTDATIIAPDDSRAWPATNNLKIGSGDGELGTALWIKDAQLKCGKERSKYTIYGTNVTNYFARKDVSNSVGVVSNETVVNLDDSTYYLSDGGIYRDEERISDLIEPDVDAISKDITQTVLDTWDSRAEFAKGTFYGSTVTAGGFLKNNEGTVRINTADTQPAGTFLQMVTTGYSDTGDVGLVVGAQLPGHFRAYPGRIGIWGRVNNAATCANGKFSITISNLNQPGLTNSNPVIYDMEDFTTSFSQFTEPIQNYVRPNFDPAEINLSSFGIRIQNVTGNALPSGCVFDFYAATNTQSSTVDVFASSTTQFISDIATNTSLTSWGRFDSINNTNGGSISFFIRNGNSVANLLTQLWSPVTPGAGINASASNSFVQWAATMAALETGDPTNIDNVTISFIRSSGSFSNRAFAIDWKNRYWLATSTDGGNVFSLIYVKSRITNQVQHAWMPVEGINIRCFAKTANVLYGGSSNSGTIYRLDYGTNFNGSTIPYVYDAPDMPLGGNYTSKNVLSYLLDADKDSGLTLTVGSSIDGADFTNKTVSLDGSGRLLYNLKGVTNPCKTLRVRLSHSILDKSFGINDLTILYQPTSIIEAKP